MNEVPLYNKRIEEEFRKQQQTERFNDSVDEYNINTNRTESRVDANSKRGQLHKGIKVLNTNNRMKH